MVPWIPYGKQWKFIKSKIIKGLSIHENQDNNPRIVTGFSFYLMDYLYTKRRYSNEFLEADVITHQVEDELLKEMQKIIQKVINPNYLIDMSKPETNNIEKIKNSIKKALAPKVIIIKPN